MKRSLPKGPCQRALAVAVVLLAMLHCASSPAQQEIRFEKGQSEHDVRMAFKLAVLQTAMEKTVPKYGPYTITTNAPTLNTLRAKTALQEGRLLNVYIALTDNEWEELAIPIRIPVRRGILSYRLLMVHKDDLPLYAKVRSLEELRHLRGGSLQSWTTTSIMELAGLQVVTANTYDGLFSMLDSHRFDYLPRGIHEVFDEFDQYTSTLTNIVIEPELLLFIPTPSYVFVSKKEPELAKRLEEGLEMMVKDQSLKMIVDRYFGAAIQRANLQKRRLISLPNPLLPKATPFDRPELWFDPLLGK